MRRVIPILLWAAVLHAQELPRAVILDAVGDTAIWSPFRSTGVIVARATDPGREGTCLRFDVEFPKGSGYGGVAGKFDVPLPDNFQIVFYLRATVPVNNFEVKVSDDTAGENIWWVNQKSFSYPSAWKRIVVKKRHLAFAWGPRPATSPQYLRRLEFVVTAGTGGRGSVWIDGVELQAIPPTPAPLPAPRTTASSGVSTARLALAGSAGAWKSGGKKEAWWQVDWGYRREFGGVRVAWDTTHRGLDYDVLTSDDGTRYDTVRQVRGGKGGPVLVFTPEAEGRYLRVLLHGQGPNRLEELDVIPSESLATRNHYLEFLASLQPRGRFPRMFLKEATYWTVVGVPDDRSEALVNEDGMFEVDKQSFSLEPFLWLDPSQRLLTWADGNEEQSLEEGYMPVPTVRRTHGPMAISITVLAAGEAGASSLAARYMVKNNSSEHQQGSLFLAIRPYQTNPPYQWLNFDGGTSSISSIRFSGASADVDGRRVLVSGSPTAGATTIDAGEVVQHLASGTVPSQEGVTDPTRLASGAFRYAFALAPSESMIVVAAVPQGPSSPLADRQPTPQDFEDLLLQSRSFWDRRLGLPQWEIPGSARSLFLTVKSMLGYILINKDGPGIQPGSRSYERSWIRDGSLTSTALLKFGMPGEVKRFLAWYAPYQYENGMVPCVVDTRGPDPVPEHDSHGQLIYALMEYFRFTRDTAFLRQFWPNIVRAVDHMQSLRAQRMTPVYRDGDDELRAYYGLVTESISHEGYSAKAMHSYWDDFFVLKGFKDAASAAQVLNEAALARSYDSLAAAFRGDLHASIALAMKNRKVDYIPGCVELGDFDATSTSIAMFPCGEFLTVPQAPFRRTFEKYYEWFQQRARGEIPWEAYTPYELRNVGTFVYLGQKARAHSMLDWFLQDQRPQGWNHWAEVVWSNNRLARFIGDMPHTWVGSDFINAVRSMFLYERDDDGAFVIGAGLKDEWVREGIGVQNLPTHDGSVSMRISSPAEHVVSVRLSGTVDASRHRILVATDLLSRPLRGASVNGLPTTPEGGFVTVSRLPATVELAY